MIPNPNGVVADPLSRNRSAEHCSALECSPTTAEQCSAFPISGLNPVGIILRAFGFRVFERPGLTARCATIVSSKQNHLTMKRITTLLLGLLAASLLAADSTTTPAPAPTADRVGFPKAYAETFQVLRTVNKEKELKVVTVYGNGPAASVTHAAQLPYPYGSVIVMETAGVLTNAQGKPLLDEQGRLRRDKVAGLHVMRREKDFGAAYGPNRTAEWEYVEYRADGSHITPPQKSDACAECHVKAGAKRDFVYRGRLPADASK